jgi:hypothetical protein
MTFERDMTECFGVPHTPRILQDLYVITQILVAAEGSVAW